MKGQTVPIHDDLPELDEGVMETYWMVHAVTGGCAPNHKHQTREQATKEAKRLAFASPGTCFTVLQVIDCYRRRPETERVRVVGPDLPF